jgi:hypothetical protein
MPTSFLTDTNVNLPTVEIKTTTDPNSGREFVKVMVVGSAKGVVKINIDFLNVGYK